VTRGSHRPSLATVAARALVDHALVPRGGVVLVACSGGPDSTALLHVLARLGPRLGFGVVGHGVDHGLRAAAADELACAAEVARAMKVPFEVTRVEVGAGGNLQARARRARLEALVAAARACEAAVIATGHTADDRAETVLMRLLRGSGPTGLAALPPRAPAPGAPDLALVRPILRARRTDVLAHVARNGLVVATDPSNVDPRFLRVRVRREVLPLLATLDPRIVEHLCDLADMLGALEAADGPEKGLGKAQRQAVERARLLGRSGVRLRVRGGRDVDVRLRAAGEVAVEAAAAPGRKARRAVAEGRRPADPSSDPAGSGVAPLATAAARWQPAKKTR
jgi:tRNA(Ile)-lysidine synthase